jgi:hypothetical protein
MGSDPSASRHRKHHLRTPSEELSRPDKLIREALHVKVLLGILVPLLLAGGYAAAFDLNSWQDWVVVGGICVTVIGVIIAISPTRK